MTTRSHAAPQDQPARTGQGKDACTRKLPRGYGSMRNVPLNVDPRIDLTKPV